MSHLLNNVEARSTPLRRYTPPRRSTPPTSTSHWSAMATRDNGWEDRGGHVDLMLALCFTRVTCVYFCAGSLSGKSGFLLKILRMYLCTQEHTEYQCPPAPRKVCHVSKLRVWWLFCFIMLSYLRYNRARERESVF